MIKQLSPVLLTLGLIISFHSYTSAQLADGAIAPDFTLTDLDGNTYRLYDVLDQGKHVVLEFSATWCGPCWNYHNTGHLENLYHSRGPGGTHEMEIFYIEGSSSTNTACLYGSSGCSNSTYGDWTHVPYPIFSPIGSGLSVVNDYQVGYFPTFYVVNANDRRIWEVGAWSSSTHEFFIDNSFQLDASFTSQNQSCSNHGFIDVTATGGAQPLSYRWSDGSTSEDLNNITQGGDYYLTITDNWGYFEEYGPIHIQSETHNPNIVALADILQPVSCNGASDGIINMVSQGGYNDEYYYAWSNGHIGELATNLYAGYYEMTVTDGVGCTNIASFFLDEPVPVEAMADTTPACEGLANGTMSVNGTVGTAPFYYDFGNGYQSDNTLENLAPGQYGVTVSDFNGCTVVTQQVVGENMNPEVEIMADHTVLDCEQTVITLEANNQNEDVSYEWYQSGVLAGTGASLDVEEANEYTLIITEVTTGCSDQNSITITREDEAPSISSNNGEVTCANPEIQLCAESEEGVSISWKLGDEIITETCIVVDAEGMYEATATASNGCTSTSVSEVTSNFEMPELLQSEGGSIGCDGSAFISLEAGNTTSILWYHPDGSLYNDDNINEIEVFVEGQFTFELINGESGCIETGMLTVEENTEAPSFATYSTVIDCNNDVANLSIEIENQENYDINWIDEEGNVIANETQLTVSEEGIYQVQVTSEFNLCTAIDQVEVIPDFSVVEVDGFDVVPVTCSDAGSIAFTTMENEEDYTTRWTDSNGEEVSAQKVLVTDIPGEYTLHLTYLPTGCISESSVEIGEVIVTPNADFIVSEGESGFVAEGMPQDNMSYEWLLDGQIVGSDLTLELMFEETQLVELCLNAENDCSLETSCLTLQYVAPLVVEIKTIDNLCFGDQQGAIDIDVSGGLPEIEISVVDANGNIVNTNDLADGLYTVNVSDADGNSFQEDVLITSPEELVTTYDVTDVGTVNGSDGSIDLNISGGVSPYEVTWSNGLVQEDLVNVSSGYYSCVILDANMCQLIIENIWVDGVSSLDNPLQSQISVYPNPVQDVLKVQTDLNVLDVEILNIEGKRIALPSSMDNINTSNLEPGIYMLRVYVAEGILTTKIIKQ